MAPGGPNCPRWDPDGAVSFRTWLRELQAWINATSARLTPAVSTREDLNEVKRNEQIKGIRSILRPIIYMLWAIYFSLNGGARSILYCPVFIRLKIENDEKSS